MSEPDAVHMTRALSEARKGRPSPNPHVGAVIVKDETVIAVGHHERAGLAHAEVAALEVAGQSAAGSTLYCTLAPCNHVGRTPPCTDAIIEAGVARVVIGCDDPAPHVPGGVEKLRAAGIDVTVGVLEDEAKTLIRDFSRHIETGLPYVVLKAAVTLDGRMATRTGDSRWITSIEARTEAHRMRDRADGVLVGVGTVLADDPQLTVRHVDGANPARLVLDSGLRTPTDSRLLDGAAETWIFHGPRASAERRHALETRGATLIEVPLGERGLDLAAVLRETGKRDVVRLLVEGGPSVHGALLCEGLAQALAVFVAPKLLGDPEAPALAVAGPAELMSEAWQLMRPTTRTMGVDVLIEGEVDPTSGRGYE